ncbi:SHOCT domain-containing protein [uncultured Acetobacterium sp.]|uniref:SHOCT domain-containing protein n=1 Tax=uncultured Acetobacterium sp. TaxID=217139 RepID=UPI0025F8A0E8|nr:SHOCT domain-containing protein [uncultured Acetobacterium sp.]
MGLKDLFKDVTDLAKESIDSIQADLALKKEEQDRLRAEMELRIKTYTDTLLEQLLNPADAPAQPLINATDEEVLEFTKEFNEKLLFPANSPTATRIDMYPDEEKLLKNILKTFSTYTDQEKFLFQFKDSKGQTILLTTSNLYFKVLFPENHSFFVVGSIPKEKLFSITITKDTDHCKLLVNGITLITSPAEGVKDIDIITLTEYLWRLSNNDFVIADDQVDAFIAAKLDPTTREIVKSFLEPDEQLVYFAWGMGSLVSKKFITCTSRKIVLYDRDLDTRKSFPYDQILSLTTQLSTVSFLDLSLTMGMNPNDTEIKTADAIETISILYAREAQQIIKIYNDHKPAGVAAAAPDQPSSEPSETVTPTAAPAQEDPIAMIEKLAGLKEKGIISEEEFNQKKQELLAKL